MYFPVSGVEVNPFIPPAVAFVISFLGSMGGISGAFLLLPFQMSFLGYTHPSVSATNQVFNIIAIPSGVYRYAREGRLVWPLVWIVVIGTLPGIFLGAMVRVLYLPDASHFKLFAASLLLYLSLKMLLSMRNQNIADKNLEEKVKQNTDDKSLQGRGVSKITKFNLSRLCFHFYDTEYDIPIWGIASLSFVVGIVGGIYGIGGGAIIAPFFITFFKLPVYIVAGATLMGTFVTSIAAVAFYSAIAPYYPNLSIAPDLSLGLLFGLGGSAGMYFGARCQKFMPARIIKYILSFSMLFTACKYVLEFFNM